MADIDSREFNFELEPPTGGPEGGGEGVSAQIPDLTAMLARLEQRVDLRDSRSEEHTSELQSPCNLVCRLLLEKKKKHPPIPTEDHTHALRSLRTAALSTYPRHTLHYLPERNSSRAAPSLSSPPLSITSSPLAA